MVDNQPGGLGVIGLPHLDAGPFLSYGIQWITFGVFAPILLGYFVYSEVRARRAEQAQASRPANARQSRRPSRTNSPTATDGGAEPGEHHHRCRLHGPRKPHGAAQIGHRWRRSVAEHRADLQFVVVLGRPAESHAQRAGERRFDDAGVGAGMTAGVATPGSVSRPHGDPPTIGAHTTVSAAVARAAT